MNKLQEIYKNVLEHTNELIEMRENIEDVRNIDLAIMHLEDTMFRLETELSQEELQELQDSLHE